MSTHVHSNLLQKPLTVALVAATIGTGIPAQAVAGLSLAVSPAGVNNLPPTSALVEGRWGNCKWGIYDGGALYIYPVESTDGKLDPKQPSVVLPWMVYAVDIKSVTIEQGVVFPQNSSELFSGLTTATDFDLSEADVSNVTNMDSMFEDCFKLTSVNLAGWNLQNTVSMIRMFKSCTSLEVIDLSDLGVSNVQFVDFMFLGCSALKDVKLDNWAFATDAQLLGMFQACTTLESLDLSSWDVSKVSKADQMFYGCNALKKLDISSWQTKFGIQTNEMFANCRNLESLDFSGWNGPNSLTNPMFDNTNSLQEIKVGANYRLAEKTFPDATASNGMWWSEAAGQWFTKMDILVNRQGIADIYRAKADFAHAVIAPIADQIFNGAAIEPPVSVSLVPPTSSSLVPPTSIALVEGVDYDLSFEKNVDVGTATVWATGKGLYEGVIKAFFNILPKEVTVTADDFTKVEGEADPTFTATVDGTVNGDTVKYTIERVPGDKPGIYDLIAKGAELQGNYKVTFKPGTLTITKKADPTPDPRKDDQSDKTDSKHGKPAKDSGKPAKDSGKPAKKAALPKTDDPFSLVALQSLLASGALSAAVGEAMRRRWKSGE